MSTTVAVIGPFKSGTSTIQYRLWQLDGLDVDDEKHWFYRDNEIYIIPLRNTLDIYISAYFQDITEEGYEYRFSEKIKDVLNAPIDTLIEHFLKFDFRKYEYCNYKRYFQYIKDNFGIQVNLDDVKDYYIYESSTRIGFYYTNRLSDIELFKKFLIELGIYKSGDDKPLNSDGNITKDKWCGDKYVEFKNKIVNDSRFIQKYNNLI